jgi:hypothetical protein
MTSTSESLLAAFLRLLLDFFDLLVFFFFLFFRGVSSELTRAFFFGRTELGTSSSSEDSTILFFFRGRTGTSSSSEDSTIPFFFCGQTGGLNGEIGVMSLVSLLDNKMVL